MITFNIWLTKKILPIGFLFGILMSGYLSAATINIRINLDYWGSETSWKLEDPNGDNIAHGGPYSNKNDNEIIDLNVASTTYGDYKFTIDDSYGDGINDNDGDGADYRISVNGNVRYQSENLYNFGKQDVRAFNISASDDVDTDGDGVLDFNDIDDDNDGILDVVEGLFDFSDLISVFKANGDANISPNEMNLTAASGNQNGSVMSLKPISLKSSFSLDAEIYLGNDDGGADGMTFILHNDSSGSDAIYSTSKGSRLAAYNGISDGISIEFDTYNSGTGSDDIAADHTQIRDTDYDWDDTNGGLTTVTALSNLEDGTWHTFHVEWDAQTSTLSYTLDGTATVSLTDTDIANTYFGGSNLVYFGFTAGTGGLYNEQKVRNIASQALSIKDTDNDGISDYHDLDSDNDGIPDNVEAQPTSGTPGYKEPNRDADASTDGLDSAYGGGLTPVDTDSDGTPDFLDTDSDNDDIIDCEEGIPNNIANKVCPAVPGGTDTNGLAEWVETGGTDQGYNDVNGIVNDPLLDLQDILDTTDGEVDYRQFNTCGPSTIPLKKLQWKIISFGCHTDSNSIETLLKDSLGDYGNSNGQHWVLYEQIAFTGSNADDMRLMSAGDSVHEGQGYWIITDRDANMTVNLKDTGVAITKTGVENSSNYGISSTVFDDVKKYDDKSGNPLPNSQSNRKTKVLIGNPFHKKFQLSDMYYNHAGGTYYPMGSIDNNTSVEATVYAHDSSDTTSDNNEYIPINPVTPGFTEEIKPMLGFFLLLRVDSNAASNNVLFPLEK